TPLGDYYLYALLGAYPNTQIQISGDGSTNAIILGKYAYVNYSADDENTKPILARAASNQHLNITYLVNKGIVNGALNIQNQGNIDEGSVSVGTLINQGCIKNAYIGIWGEKDGQISLDTFDNQALIYNPTTHAVFFENKVSIANFTNEGVIVGGTTDTKKG
ncbi:hypothetical protein LNU06_07600, partial [Campylobacter sp. VicNov18]